ncbi:MAG: hypothetical protein AMS25_14315 [Gemmatimonas sp. SM23_52]|jgi:Tol biopolymer transport system component|nr:MAG: hypothetical protein AMS25_14315 [Gemmatimonas sp. SM23_52]
MFERVTALALPVLATLLTLSCAEPVQQFEWGAPRNLGPNINSPGKDEHPTFPRSGTTMVFASIREAGQGGYDLFMSHLEHGEWSPAQALPPPINTERDEFDPFITLDGSRLFFASNRDNPGAYWDCDIYVAEWNGETWGQPLLYDSLFVTPDLPDWGPTLTEDLQTFVFSSGRTPAKPRSVQIFQSEWLGDHWSDPVPLPQPVNSGGWEATPYVSPDGKTLYLNSDRGDPGKRDVDIWRFQRVDGRWTHPRLMTGPFLSAQHDYDPCLTPDREHFYFTSNRAGGLGDSDIYVAERVRRGE